MKIFYTFVVLFCSFMTSSLPINAVNNDSQVLVIDSSINGNKSFTRKFTQELSDKVQAKYKNVKIIKKDLSKTPYPRITGEVVHAIYTKAEERDNRMKAILKISDEAISDLLKSNLIIIGAPMYNFTIPSTLKDWIDNIVRAGVTFKYDEQGAVGLVKTNAKVVIVVASGGLYSSEPMKSLDHDASYLKAILGFLGLNDIEVITIGGTGMGEKHLKETEEVARKQIDIIVKNLPFN